MTVTTPNTPKVIYKNSHLLEINLMVFCLKPSKKKNREIFVKGTQNLFEGKTKGCWESWARGVSVWLDTLFQNCPGCGRNGESTKKEDHFEVL